MLIPNMLTNLFYKVNMFFKILDKCIDFYTIKCIIFLVSGYNNFVLRTRIHFNETETDIMEKKKNSNIHCTVKQCANNMETEDYCTLDMVKIGTHESDPKVPECTDCNSFVKRSGCSCH